MNRIRTIVAFVLGMIVASAGLRAQEAPAEQRWKGVVELPGMPLDFSVRLTGSGGTISIPVQGVRDLALKDVAIDGAAMRFVLALPGMPEAAWAAFEATIAEDGASAAGSLKQAGQSFPVKMTRLEAGAVSEDEPPRPQTPKPPFPYSSREVTFPNEAGGITIAGTLTMPPGDGPHPAVALITGSGPQDRDESIFGHKPFFVLADYLTRAGIAVLRTDDRGVGGTTGDLMKAKSEDLASDVVAGINFLKSQPEIDAKRIGLIGHSEGGALAPLAARMSGDVRVIVMLAGYAVRGSDLLRIQTKEIMLAEAVADEKALDEMLAIHKDVMGMIEGEAPAAETKARLADLIRVQVRVTAGIVPEEAAVSAMVDQQYASLSSPWFRSFLSYDPSTALRQTKVPVLALFGERDLQVPPRQIATPMREALKEAGNLDFSVRELAGLNHLFQNSQSGVVAEYAQIQETMDVGVLVLVSGWLRERFGM